MIIIVDELMSECLTEHDPDNRHKEKTNNNGTGPFLASIGPGSHSHTSL